MCYQVIACHFSLLHLPQVQTDAPVWAREVRVSDAKVRNPETGVRQIQGRKTQDEAIPLWGTHSFETFSPAEVLDKMDRNVMYYGLLGSLVLGLSFLIKGGKGYPGGWKVVDGVYLFRAEC